MQECDKHREGDENMKYIGKKLSTTLITLLCISFLVYLAFDVIPGDAALAALGTDATPESLEALREQLGLNRPFCRDMLHGCLIL